MPRAAGLSVRIGAALSGAAIVHGGEVAGTLLIWLLGSGATDRAAALSGAEGLLHSGCTTDCMLVKLVASTLELLPVEELLMEWVLGAQAPAEVRSAASASTRVPCGPRNAAARGMSTWSGASSPSSLPDAPPAATNACNGLIELQSHEA